MNAHSLHRAWQRLSLLKRLLVVNGVIVLASVMVVSWLLLSATIQLQHKQFQEEAAERLDVLSDLIAENVILGEYDSIERALRTRLKSSESYRVRWQDQTGMAIDVTVPPARSSAPGWLAALTGLTERTAHKSLVVGGVSYGSLTLTTVAVEELNTIWRVLLSGGVVVALLMSSLVVTTSLLLRRTLGPLAVLTECAGSFADGTYSTRAPQVNQPDLAPICTAFNRMAETVQGLLTRLDREQANLRASEQRFRDVTFTCSDWVWEVDVEGRYTYASGRTEQLLGYPPESIIGKTPYDLMPPEEGTRVREIFSTIAARCDPFSELENTCLRRDGSTVTVLTSGVPMFDLAGTWTGYRGVDRDVTGKVAAERLLKAREEMYANIFDHIGIGISVIAPDMTIHSLNPVMKQWFPDVDPAALPVCYAAFNNPPRKEPCLYCPTVKTLLDGATHEAVTATPTPLGCRNYKLVSSPVFDASGAITAAIEVVEDITDHLNYEQGLREAKEAAEVANEAKSIFLANMSHEIRTPLNAVIGLGALLQKTPLDWRQQDFLRKLNASARSLLHVINDILDISRIEAGKLTLEEVVFSLTESLEKVSNTIAVQAHDKGLEFRVVYPAEIPEYLGGDPFRLEQVLLNLLGNAVKFTEKGEIRLGVTPVTVTGERVLLEFCIIDTGIGLAPDKVADLFRPFSQADNSTTRRFGGVGLGLSICKRLVELMGGRITADGEPGKGSIFRFTADFRKIPASQIPALPNLPLDEDLRSIRGGRILLAEDNNINLQIARLQLTRAGFKVTTVVNGQEAVKAVEQATEPFDLVLMDLQMPVMDGYEATRHIRQSWARDELPIIAVTAHALSVEREKCLNAGMNDHLSKPYDVTDLLKKLIQWIRPRPVMPEPEPGAPEKGAVAEATTATLNLPGLDIPTALVRLGISLEIYRDFAILFAAEHKGDARIIRQRLESGDLEEARVVAHTLKGVAGNIAATPLYTTATALESELKAGRRDEAYQALTELSTHLDEVLSSVTILEESGGGAVSEPYSVDLPELLAELAGLLEARDMKAVKLFGMLEKTLREDGRGYLVDDLAVSIKKLDFSAAFCHVSAVATLLREQGERVR